MPLYLPDEDSHFFSETLKKFLYKKNKKIEILDMGSGTGILAETCRKKGFKNILTADIDKDSIKILKKKKFKVIKSNLFSKIKRKFDLIIFNPPYLPYNKYDKNPDVSGGKKGFEIIVRFLAESKTHLKNKGVIMILFSSLSKPRTILKKAKELGYKYKLLNKKNLFFEVLKIYSFSINY